MDNRFDFIRLIGKGATGGVYQARCKKTGQDFTIRRFYSEDGTYHSGWEEDFIKIVQQLSTVCHPNVSPILEASLDKDGAYVITTYKPPTTTFLDLCRNGVSIELFTTFVKHGLGALSALHNASIVHGRVSVDTFLVSKKADESTEFVLRDYGLRRIAPLIQGIDPKKKLPSNPSLLAPEHFTTGCLDERTDVYMFGQLCYVLLAGCHPTAGKSLEQVAEMHMTHNYNPVKYYEPDTPEAISQWIDALTQPQPADRPASAADALEMFIKLRPLF